MNSRRENAMLFARGLFALVLLGIALALLIRAAATSTTAHASRTAQAAQDEEKSLDINGYPNEPLELVDLKIHERSVKSAIKFKSKVPAQSRLV